MNHAYRLVWNQVRRLWQCAPEFARARGKSAAEKTTVHPVGADAKTSEGQAHHLRGQFVLRSLITALLMSGASGSVWAACTQGIHYTVEENTYTFVSDCNGKEDEPWVEHDALKIDSSGEYIIEGNGRLIRGGNFPGKWFDMFYGGDAIEIKGITLRVRNVRLEGGKSSSNGSREDYRGASINANDSVVYVEDASSLLGPLRLVNSNLTLRSDSTFNNNRELSINSGSFTAELGASVTIQDLILSNNAQVDYVDPITINGNVEIKDVNTSFVLKSGSQKTGGDLTVRGGSFTAEDNVSLVVNNLHLENARYRNNNQMTINGNVYLKNIDGFVLKTGSQFNQNKNLTVDGGSFTSESGASVAIQDLILSNNAQVNYVGPIAINGNVRLTNTNFTLSSGSVINQLKGKEIAVKEGGTFTIEEGASILLSDEDREGTEEFIIDGSRFVSHGAIQRVYRHVTSGVTLQNSDDAIIGGMVTAGVRNYDWDNGWRGWTCQWADPAICTAAKGIELIHSDNAKISAEVTAGWGGNGGNSWNSDFAFYGGDGIFLDGSTGAEITGKVTAGKGGVIYNRTEESDFDIGNGGHGVRLVNGSSASIASTVRGGDGGLNTAASPKGGYAGHGVLVRDGSTLVLKEGAALHGGSQDAGSTPDATYSGAAIFLSGNRNTVELQSNDITLAAGTGSNDTLRSDNGVLNTLALGGTGTKTFEVSKIAVGGEYDVFDTLEKRGEGTWTLTGTLGDGAITSTVVDGGVLNIGAQGGTQAHLTKAQDITVKSGTLAVNADSSLGIQSGKTLMMKAGAVLDLDKQATFTNAGAVNVEDNVTLKTNAEELNAAGASGWWGAVNTALGGNKSYVNLYTTADNVDGSNTEVAAFRQWIVGGANSLVSGEIGDITVKESASLKTKGDTTITEDKTLTVENDAAFSVESGHTLTVGSTGHLANDGTTTIKGILALDKQAGVGGEGTLTFAEKATLKTDATALKQTTNEGQDGGTGWWDAVSANLTKANVNLHTTVAFHADSSEVAQDVSGFRSWVIGGSGSTASGIDSLAAVNTIGSGADLTLKDFTLGNLNGKTINNDAGTLKLSGIIDLSAANDVTEEKLSTLGITKAENIAFAKDGESLALLKVQTNSLNLLIQNISGKENAILETTTESGFKPGQDAAHDISGFAKWQLNGLGYIVTLDELAKQNVITDSSELTVKDFELSELLSTEKSINNNRGTLKFSGEVNLDGNDVDNKISNHESNLAFALDEEKHKAVLTTAQDSLNSLIQKIGDKQNAIIKTITAGGFKASNDDAHKVSDFAGWQVASQGSTVTGEDNLAKVTEVTSNGGLTATNIALGSDQILKNSGGTLILAGETNLDSGTLTLQEDSTTSFAEGATLETRVLRGAAIQNGLLVGDKVSGKDKATLRTRDTFYATDGFASEFKNWSVEGSGSLVSRDERSGQNYLAKELTEVQSTGDLLASDIALQDTQTLRNNGGVLSFSGTTNVDNGVLELVGGQTSLADNAVLETAKDKGSAIQQALFTGEKVTGKDKATLRTLSAFDATDGFAGEFKNWEVKGAGDNTTSALAQRKTTIAEGVNLTTSITELGAAQTIDNSGKLILNTAETTRILANRITGSGEVIKQGAGTATLATGSHEYTGTTQVNTGTLSLEKQTALSGGIHVAQGATLDLSLAQSELVAIPAEPQPAVRMRRMARSLSAASTATATPSLPDLAPGVTHQVANFSLDGILNVVVNGQAANQHSHLHSLGDITLGSTSSLVINAAAYADGEGSVNDILTSDTAVKGQFGSYSDNSALFDFTPTYTDNSVSLTVKKVEQIIDEGGGTDTGAGTGTETDTGAGTETVTGGGAGENHGGRDEPTSTPTVVQSYRGVLPIIRLLDKAMNQDAESPLARRFYALQTKAQARQTAVEIQPLLGGTGNRVIAEASDLMQRYVPNERCGGGEGETSAWAHGLGDWGKQDGHQGISGYQSRHYGIALGGDVCLSPKTKVGLMAAYVNTKADAQDIHASQTLKADTWQVGVYANHAFTDRVDVDFMAAVGRANIKGERRFSYYADLKAKGDTHADILRTGAGLNLRYQAGNTELSPYARLDYTQVNTKGYTETGAKEFNLNVAKQRTQALMAGVGLKITHAVSDGLSLKAKAGVAYDLLDKGHDVQATLTSLPNQPFTIKHNKLGRTVGEVGLGMRYQATKSTSLSAEVQALFSKGRTDTTANVGVRVQF